MTSANTVNAAAYTLTSWAGMGLEMIERTNERMEVAMSVVSNTCSRMHYSPRMN
jgi:hypothetical protein